MPDRREADLLVSLQSALAARPGVFDTATATARAMSHFGEHALGWMGLSAAGAALDRRRRRGWVSVGVSAVAAHAVSVGVKRVVRRPRPHDRRVRVGVGTPSRLSFPSSHATSTSAALAGVTRVTGSRAPLVGIPAMALSRLVLGVHYPTDVAAGTLIGLAADRVTARVLGPWIAGDR
ncbi:phosphatase PAP2 family protein [Corynebacterium bovis]|uniref:Phosphatase PAP2 family protein n=5 Tax=Corynebacterium bovis TaxID=36808 RepID=A0A426Q4N1_9CORY|nr:phosphatase PAP2 family protein [Corynebacterium bovis]MDK8511661.1 phosphatase PAP2 family protein [Corynebacterium bovis]RRO90986.1 phosphatase PAP2 family protein [Corynebacterium bovis]RRO99608.1 phosphatase PAP2 family protein [Corynebacterium bovis]RRQ03339.1 phosphatase PAP2 family protein [Corynebacterium bovis]RRQ03734.1 phosphatase PAP2 family protein [Corynebacterium bovis]